MSYRTRDARSGALARQFSIIFPPASGPPRDAPTDIPPPSSPKSQVVEDILNHAEQIAVSEGGAADEVTLLRLLKVGAALQFPTQSGSRSSRLYPRVQKFTTEARATDPSEPPSLFPRSIAGVRERPPAARHRARGGHRLLPLPAQALPRPGSELVGQVREGEAADAADGGTRGDVPHLSRATPPDANARVEAR